MGEGCQCGADPSDSLSEHDLDFAGKHNVDEECACQCGDDRPYGMPSEYDCSEYEEACLDSQGATHTLSCY